MNSEQHIS